MRETTSGPESRSFVLFLRDTLYGLVWIYSLGDLVERRKTHKTAKRPVYVRWQCISRSAQDGV